VKDSPDRDKPEFNFVQNYRVVSDSDGHSMNGAWPAENAYDASDSIEPRAARLSP